MSFKPNMRMSKFFNQLSLNAKKHFLNSLLLCLLLFTPICTAETANIAVATNFIPTMRLLEAKFEETTQHELTIISGSTGKLYLQTLNGAPFDAYLSADQKHAQLLEESPKAVAGTRFTYAIGKLVLWAPNRDKASWKNILQTDTKIAIANPKLAPYGVAAMEFLEKHYGTKGFTQKLVLGENVGQAYAMVASGNASIGLLAGSFFSPEIDDDVWIIPEQDYSSIRQDALLLSTGSSNQAAIEFLSFLKSDTARKIIKNSGYDVAH